MRPVRLEMDGFASFRTATVVDFEGADYFALVGPTGSGKSTVIDAMVFALFGTAPRWDRANAVRYALAPTATRGTVRLVFDIGTDRYQIEVNASEVSSVAPEVEILLGLTFAEFTKAVVLPQGRFAEFLSAKASQRQEILLKLLGAHQYDLIMQSAGKRRSDAALDRAAIEARMEGLGHATAEAEAAAQARLVSCAVDSL